MNRSLQVRGICITFNRNSVRRKKNTECQTGDKLDENGRLFGGCRFLHKNNRIIHDV